MELCCRLVQGLAPLRVEPGQRSLRAQIAAAPQVHGHAQRQLAQRRGQGAHQALEARVVGGVEVEKCLLSRANCISQPVDLRLLSPAISPYSAARSVSVS